MIEPVRKELRVPATPDAAFRHFTDAIDTWWPKATHSVTGESCAAVRFEEREGGRRLVEESDDGTVVPWGEVSVWEPGRRLVFRWHPGREASTGQEVEVRFTADEGGGGGSHGTRIVLIHRGWEALAERPLEVRDEYERGWIPVLASYGETLAGVPAE